MDGLLQAMDAYADLKIENEELKAGNGALDRKLLKAIQSANTMYTQEFVAELFECYGFEESDGVYVNDDKKAYIRKLVKKVQDAKR